MCPTRTGCLFKYEETLARRKEGEPRMYQFMHSSSKGMKQNLCCLCRRHKNGEGPADGCKRTLSGGARANRADGGGTEGTAVIRLWRRDGSDWRRASTRVFMKDGFWVPSEGLGAAPIVFDRILASKHTLMDGGNNYLSFKCLRTLCSPLLLLLNTLLR